MKSFSSQHAFSSPTSSAGESRRNSGPLLQDLLPKAPANDASPLTESGPAPWGVRLGAPDALAPNKLCCGEAAPEV